MAVMRDPADLITQREAVRVRQEAADRLDLLAFDAFLDGDMVLWMKLSRLTEQVRYEAAREGNEWCGWSIA
jgi:hypothetical protein